MVETDDYVGRFERRRKIGIAVVVVVLAVPVLFLFSRCGVACWSCAREVREAETRREESSRAASAEQVGAVDAATAAVEASLGEKASAWAAGMAGAAKLVPRLDLGPCPVELPMRQPVSAARGGSFNNLDSFGAIVFPGRKAFPYAVAHGGLLPSSPPRVDEVRSRAAELRERIRRPGRLEDHARTVESARALGEGWTYDVVLFADVYERPFADAGGASFTPGRVHGIAVLYDYRSGSPLCAGEVTAESTSAHVEYTAQLLNEATTLQASLDAELDAEVERAIARGLRFRAGEPVPPSAGPADAGSARRSAP